MTAVVIRGTPYPVVLPKLRDPRLHLAATITSLQVLGQVGFDFWWGPMSWWLVLALAVILAGGFSILSRLSLLRVALSFWASFAVALAVLAAAGHEITARWHLGPIGGFHFWWILVTSPEVLVF